MVWSSMEFKPSPKSYSGHVRRENLTIQQRVSKISRGAVSGFSSYASIKKTEEGKEKKKKRKKRERLLPC